MVVSAFPAGQPTDWAAFSPKDMSSTSKVETSAMPAVSQQSTLDDAAERGVPIRVSSVAMREGR